MTALNGTHFRPCVVHGIMPCPPGCLAPRLDPTALEPVARPGVAIAEVPIDLERGQNVIEIKLRAPAIVRAAAFWLKTPTVLGAASMRAVEKVAMPLLFVECDPAGELVDRVLIFQSSNAAFVAREGYTAQWRASAFGQAGALHVFEIVQASS